MGSQGHPHSMNAISTLGISVFSVLYTGGIASGAKDPDRSRLLLGIKGPPVSRRVADCISPRSSGGLLCIGGCIPSVPVSSHAGAVCRYPAVSVHGYRDLTFGYSCASKPDIYSNT